MTAEPNSFDGVEFAPRYAKFSQSRNDIYWSFYAAEDGTIRWFGYDDQNWWDNVAHLDHTRQRVGKVTGRTFTVDFKTGLVEIEPAKVGMTASPDGPYGHVRLTDTSAPSSVGS